MSDHRFPLSMTATLIDPAKARTHLPDELESAFEDDRIRAYRIEVTIAANGSPELSLPMAIWARRPDGDLVSIPAASAPPSAQAAVSILATMVTHGAALDAGLAGIEMEPDDTPHWQVFLFRNCLIVAKLDLEPVLEALANEMRDGEPSEWAGAASYGLGDLVAICERSGHGLIGLRQRLGPDIEDYARIVETSHGWRLNVTLAETAHR